MVAVYESTQVGVCLSLVTEMVMLHSGTIAVEMPWEPIYYL
jgi:hypothetical protein